MQVRSRLSHAALMRTLSIVCRTDLSDPLVTLVTKKSSSWSAISSVAKCWKEAVIKCDKITEAPCKRREHLSNLLLSFFFVLVKGKKGKIFLHILHAVYSSSPWHKSKQFLDPLMIEP